MEASHWKTIAEYLPLAATLARSSKAYSLFHSTLEHTARSPEPHNRAEPNKTHASIPPALYISQIAHPASSSPLLHSSGSSDAPASLHNAFLSRVAK